MNDLKKVTLEVDGVGLQLIWQGLDQLPHGAVVKFVQNLQGQVAAQLQAAQGTAAQAGPQTPQGLHPIDPPQSPVPPVRPGRNKH